MKQNLNANRLTSCLGGLQSLGGDFETGSCKSTLSGGEGGVDTEISGRMKGPFPRGFLEWRIEVMDAG